MTKRTLLKSTDDEYGAWKKQATADGCKSVSEWIRQSLNKACIEKPIETLPNWGDNNRKGNHRD